MTETYVQTYSLPEGEGIFPNEEFLCAPEEVEFSAAQLEIIDGWHQDSVTTSLQLGRNVQTREEYYDKAKRWLTGNYDPESGMHTLYRFVDQPGVDAIQQYGALISRVVQYFGGGSDFKAVDQLEKLAAGNITEEAAAVINRYFKKDKPGSFSGAQEHTYLENLAESESGMEDISRQAMRALLDIKAVLDPDLDTLFKRVQEELLTSAAGIEGTLYGLFHSSIHMTTEPHWNLWPVQYRVALHIQPGSIVPVGTFKNDNFVGIPPDSEWEWTTFGAAYPLKPEDITIERVENVVNTES